MPVPLLIIGGIAAGTALAGGGVGLGLLLGDSGSTAENLTTTVINSTIDVVNTNIMEMTSEAEARNTILVSDVEGDVVIEGVRQNASVTVSVEGFLEAMNSTAIQQQVAQNLSQMAESVVSGIPMGSSESKNITDTIINSSASILNETRVLCQSEANATNSLTVIRVGGKAVIKDIEQNAVINTVLKCSSSAINQAIVEQKTDQTIEQTATAILKGLNLADILLPLIIIAGIIIVIPMAMAFTVTRTITSITESTFGKLLPAVIIISVLVFAGFVFMSLGKGSKGKVVMTCIAELANRGECTPLDDPSNPAIGFPLVNPAMIAAEMGRKIVTAQGATSFAAALAAARANADVKCFLWNRDSRTWDGYDGSPDPKAWVATVRGSTVTPSRYSVPGTRVQILGLYRRYTDLMRSLYCMSLGVAGAFDPTKPGAEPSQSMCRTMETGVTEGKVTVNGQEVNVPAADKPQFSDFQWNPTGRASSESGNLWATADTRLLFHLLRGETGAPDTRLSICLYPAEGKEFTDTTQCPNETFVLSDLQSGIAYLNAAEARLRARKTDGKQPPISDPVLVEWTRAKMQLVADIERGYDHYNNGDVADVETIRNVAVLFPTRTHTAMDSTPTDPKVYWLFGGVGLLVLGAAFISFRKYLGAQDKAKAAQKSQDVMAMQQELSMPPIEPPAV